MLLLLCELEKDEVTVMKTRLSLRLGANLTPTGRNAD